MNLPVSGNLGFSLRSFSSSFSESLPVRPTHPDSGQPPHQLQIATLLDASTGHASATGPVAELISSGRARTLGEALSQLNPSERLRLQGLWGRSLDELDALSHERDTQLFFSGLMQVGQRLEDGDQLEMAGLVYSALAAGNSPHPPLILRGGEEEVPPLRIRGGQEGLSPVPAQIHERAQIQLNAMNGVGDWRNRLAFSLRRVSENATRPDMLIAMGGAGIVFRGVRLVATARFAGSFESALGLRAAANGLGFLAETAAFTGIGKVAGAAFGRPQDWSPEAVYHEWAGGAAMLLGLKVVGGAFGHLSERWAAGETAFARVTRAVAPQAGMFGGILVGNRLAEWGGFHPHREGDTWLVDGLTTLLEFNVAGRLQASVMGPGFARFERRMDLHTERMSSGRPAWSEAFRNWMGGAADLVTAEGVRMSILPESSGDGLEKARELYSQMTGEGSPGSHREKVMDTGIRDDVDSALPRRSSGFERALSPQDTLRRIPSSVRDEILDRLDMAPEEISHISDKNLGFALGHLLQERMAQIYSSSIRLDLDLEAIQEGNYANIPTLSALENSAPDLMRNVRSLSEIIGIIEYNRRSNNTTLLNEVRRAVSGDARQDYVGVKSIVGNLLGPRLLSPTGLRAMGEEVIQPNQGVVLIGGGDMASVGRVISHQIMPGGLPFYYRIWVITRTASTANEINTQGTYRRKLPNVVFNYDGEPPLIAIPETAPNLRSEVMARVDRGEIPLPTDILLKRLVRVQFLNVASLDLPPILSKDYLERLPEDAILAHAIGALIKADPRPGSRAKYPHHLVRDLLDANARGDVEVGTLSGFIPGKYMWEGTPVTVGIAMRETESGSGMPRPAARLLVELLAGSTLGTRYVTANISHWETSANVGKVLKNIEALQVGFRAGSLARPATEGTLPIAEAELKSRQEWDRAWEIMLGVLRENEVGIKREAVGYRLEVKNDFDECMKIEFRRVLQFWKELSDFAEDPQTPVRERSPDEIKNFFQEHLVKNRFEFARTRNIVRGLMQVAWEYLVSKGMNFHYSQVLPAMTEEGANSITPLIEYYHHPSHPIENRRLFDEIYTLERSLTGEGRKELPPRIPPRVRQALDESPENGYQQEILGRIYRVDPRKLRTSLERVMQRSINLLDDELETLDMVRERQGLVNPTAVVQQWEVVSQVLEAMRDTNPVMVVRSPYLAFPYQRLYKISGISPYSDRAFITVDGRGIMDRVTQLGLFIRGNPAERNLRIEVEMTGVDEVEDAGRIKEAKLTAQKILTAFEQSGRPNVELEINSSRIKPTGEVRDSVNENTYYPALKPLMRMVLGIRGDADVPHEQIRQILRRPRIEFSNLLDHFIHSSKGWPMLLGEFYAGPIHQAVRAALTRPEKGTVLGVYHQDQLVDAFTLFRSSRNAPQVVAHHLMREFENVLGRDYGPHRSLAFFEGLPLEEFLRDYEELARQKNEGEFSLRVMDIRSLLLEEALTGRFLPEVNPVSLRHFLNRSSSKREEFLRELSVYYSRPANEPLRKEFRDFMQRYLRPFEETKPTELEQDPLYRLLEDNPDALSLIVRGRYFEDGSRQDSPNGGGGSSLPPVP